MNRSSVATTTNAFNHLRAPNRQKPNVMAIYCSVINVLTSELASTPNIQSLPLSKNKFQNVKQKRTNWTEWSQHNNLNLKRNENAIQFVLYEKKTKTRNEKKKKTAADLERPNEKPVSTISLHSPSTSNIDVQLYLSAPFARHAIYASSVCSLPSCPLI